MSTGRLGAGDTAIQPTILDAKGDLIVATAADTPARLAVGANDTVLTADSSTATGLKWAAVAAGGKVLQVVQATYSTSTNVTSTSYTDTGLTASITPSASSSKVLVMITQQAAVLRNNDYIASGFKVVRGATDIYERPSPTALGGGVGSAVNPRFRGGVNVVYLDSPNTTSSTTYKTQGRVDTTADAGTVEYQQGSATSSIILMEIGA